ncbi:hypothetical protein EPN44_03790 [bacterium]|nr:MAG: hypothetical protein EPN44_03790 [bacterium]
MKETRRPFFIVGQLLIWIGLLFAVSLFASEPGADLWQLAVAGSCLLIAGILVRIFADEVLRPAGQT